MIMRVITKTLSALVLTSTVISINAYASSDSADEKSISGKIYFTGYIVHSPCKNELKTNEVNLDCLNEKADIVNNKIDLHKASLTKDWVAINDGRTEYSYNWINKNKKLGTVTVRYN